MSGRAMDRVRHLTRAIVFVALALSSSGLDAAEGPCRIEVVEKGSGWPVPLVELQTTHHRRFVTDNAGVIAFGDSELMGAEVWFDVSGHGYSVPRDGLAKRDRRGSMGGLRP